MIKKAAFSRQQWSSIAYSRIKLKDKTEWEEDEEKEMKKREKGNFILTYSCWPSQPCAKHLHYTICMNQKRSFYPCITY